MTPASETIVKPAEHGVAAMAADLAALKIRQHAAWSSGDYAVIGATLQIVGEELCEALDLRAGERVLDVAAGNGNVSLAAARRWCDVVSTDYVPSLLERGRARANADGLTIEFKEADAEALPFADGAFDTVLSTFGVMFTPNHDQAAAELMRVCKSGGKIGLANWTPEGLIGQVFKTLGRYLPPPAGAKSPLLWGTRGRLTAMFGPARRRDQRRAAHLQLSLPLARALPGGLENLLWPDAQGVRGARRGEPGRSQKRPARPLRQHEQSRRRNAGGAERVSGGSHYEAIRRQGNLDELAPSVYRAAVFAFARSEHELAGPLWIEMMRRRLV